MTIVSQIVPPPQAETPQQRRDRLYAKAKAQRIRLRNCGNGTFAVPSLHPALHPAPYTVRVLAGIQGLVCDCEWGQRQGAYTPKTPRACCAHAAKVEVYLERQAAEHERAARRSYVAYQAQTEPPVTKAQRAAQAFNDLYGEVPA